MLGKLKLLINWILGLLGYQIRGKVPFHKYSSSGKFSNYFNDTEGMISYEEAKLLYDLAREIKTGCIVEVGSYRGRSTVALGRGSIEGHKVPVFAVDPHENFNDGIGINFGPPDRAAFFKTMLDSDCYHVVRLINLSSEIVAPNWQQTIGLLWIDGDHSYEAVKRDFHCWLPHLAPNAIIAFHDSTNPKLGPWKLITEVTENNRFQVVAQVGLITVINKS